MPTDSQIPEAGRSLSVATGSASVGRSQRKASQIWEDFKREELQFVDMLELCAVLMVNVADKSGATDHEVAHWTRKITADMRHRASLQNARPSATPETNL